MFEAARGGALLVENCLDRDQARRPAVVLQPRAGDRDTAAAAVGALGVAEMMV